MKTIFFAFFLLMASQISAQTKFNYHNDFKKILAKTQNKKSNLAYDKLLARFAINDTKMSDYEVLALMIGFTVQPAYKPYLDIEIEREIFTRCENKQYADAIRLADSFLITHPLSIKAIEGKAFSHSKLGERDMAKFYYDKSQKLLEAMFFSGNGKTQETPIFALNPADGEEFIQLFIKGRIGIRGSSFDKNNYFLDMLELKLPDQDGIILYFIINHATKTMFSTDDINKADEEKTPSKNNKKNK